MKHGVTHCKNCGAMWEESYGPAWQLHFVERCRSCPPAPPSLEDQIDAAYEAYAGRPWGVPRRWMGKAGTKEEYEERTRQ